MIQRISNGKLNCRQEEELAMETWRWKVYFRSLMYPASKTGAHLLIIMMIIVLKLKDAKEK
jgi:hypothetical protein